MLKLRGNKFYFVLRHRAALLQFKYITFLGAGNLRQLWAFPGASKGAFFKARATELPLLLKGKNLKYALGYDLLFFGCDDYLKLDWRLLKPSLCGFLFSGHFLNITFLAKLASIYDYYNTNFNNYISMIRRCVKLQLCQAFLCFVKIAIALSKTGVVKMKIKNREN